jgi:transcriptional regulator with XRE-family HTH domain
VNTGGRKNADSFLECHSAPSRNAPLDAYIGAKLRIRRTALGLRQGEIARRLGVTPQQLSKYEQAIDRISASRLYLLSKILAISPGFFFEGLDSVTEDFSIKISRIPKDHKIKIYLEGIISHLEVEKLG